MGTESQAGDEVVAHQAFLHWSPPWKPKQNASTSLKFLCVLMKEANCPEPLVNHRPPRNNSHWENMNTQENTRQCAGKTHSWGDSSSKHVPPGYVFGTWSLHCPVQVSVLDHTSPAALTRSCPDLTSEMGCRRHVNKGGALDGIWWEF